MDTRRSARPCVAPAATLIALLATSCGGTDAAGSTTPVTVATSSTVGPVAATTATTWPVATATTAAPIEPIEEPSVRITIVYDNVVYDERLTGDWGFAAYIEYGDRVVLFDTGADAAILMNNMGLLGVDVDAIDVIVLSHHHHDHTGGLLGLLQETGITPAVYMPASFSAAIRDPVAALTTVVDVTDPVEIVPGIFTTGELGSGIIEQALVVDTDQGNVVVAGCSHPGIAAMVRRAQEVTGEGTALALGGFHLLSTAPDEIASLISELRDLGVQQVGPSHCTGEEAIVMFAEAYGDDYVESGVGRVIVVG